MSKRPRNNDELFELKWNNFSSSITDEIFNLRQNDTLVDLSFCCEGVIIGCHKLIVYACSPVLRNILSKTPSQHPIIYVTDIKLHILRALLNYIYQGEVHISKSDLVSFMKAADSFQIKGLQSKRMESAIYGSENEFGDESLDSSKNISKKRRAEPVPAVASTSRADPLKQEVDNSNLDYSEFENEFTYEEGNESVDEPETLETTINGVAEKLRNAINFADDGPNILHEFELEQNLSEQSKEELIDIFWDYLSRTYPRVTRSKRELIAEAALTIFPGVFGDDPKTLADLIRTKGSSITDGKIQGEPIPEAFKLDSKRDGNPSKGLEDVGSEEDVVEFEVIHPLLFDVNPDTYSLEDSFPQEYEYVTDARNYGKSRTSSVWLAFDMDVARAAAVCKKCQGCIRHTKIGPTSNMLKHLRNKTHIDWFRKICKEANALAFEP